MLGCLEEVTRLEASALSTEDTKALVALRERVERQLEKVRRNEFHIAVVGLEKAGKSTFLNAWLRHDLLPNAQERCTYATTELRSSETQGSHELLIEYLDRAQFEQDVKRYKEIAASGLAEARGAEADLEEIHHFGKTLQGLLGRERERLTYASLDEMRPHLQRFVANPEVARALRSVTLRSAQLYHKSGVVFHDVPGYDSPISMHQALAREELARADAILFVTNLAANTSLTRDQLRMLEVADAEDPELKARDKLFVFLNKIDGAGSKSDLMERIEKAKQQWCHGPQQCKPERVIPGSAGAYLLTQCSPVQEKTRAMLEAAPGRLRELDAPHGDGIEHLRTQVEHYLEHERAGLLARRHEALVDQGMTLAQRVLSTLSSGYPTSLAELDIADRVERDSAIHDWLDSQWARFQSEFATYWNRSVMPAASDDEPQQLNTDFQRVKTAYSEALGSLKAQLNDANLRPTLSSIHDRIRQQYATPVEANLELRRQLSDRIIAPSLEQVTEQMASTFLLQFERIGEKVSELFFGLESVRKHVLPGEVAAYQDQLSLGFSTLFLRNARPCLTLMLQKPRGKVFRQRMMDIYRPEALSLQSFYDNPAHPERADLPRFLLGAPMLPPQG
jgi:GTPase Era involved in 16S rRNA processing